MPDTVISVFVSRPTWVESNFEEGLNGFLRVLVTLGLRPRTLGKTDYPRRAPLDEVIALLDECSGAIILGYPQIRVSSGLVRDKPVEKEFSLPTEWNHIEAGLAYARQLPLLLIHHQGVVRGIFDRGATNSYIYERDLAIPHWSLAEDIQGALQKWLRECLGIVPLQPRTSGRLGELPTCPNCSTHARLAYMNPLPPDFAIIEGVTHECPQCDLKLTVRRPT
jgi:hypothetical protein